ncbi:HD domain-containing protein [Actinophytocola gossypii]|uniref:HD domain-containing protein n=1 Tax=Actinophytocola gossypii TaxID=2812003 RepID=A0ABT2JHK3_9PSEU|nr:HD domain-containing protein [Actinophytocola gossypii]MCT2586749.1 HD domain-containing protein [Actinophytocola gossypii]
MRTFTMDDAIQFARRAHEGQLDKSGRPYIAHPLRVMGSVRGDHERMTAVLHDVVEDTAATLDDLTAAGCPAEVLAAVAAISQAPDEPQARYLDRVLANPIALAVKRADIADNMSSDRMGRLDASTQQRLRTKYEAALRQLNGQPGPS